MTRTASGRRAGAWALALTSVGAFMVSLDNLVVITALPAIHRDVGGTVSTLQWTVNAYTLTFAAGIITAAALGDRLGRRRVYAVGLLLFAAASAACALAPDAASLIGARAVQGLGAAIVAPLSLTILTAAFPPARRGAIIGIWGGLASLAIAAGPLAGGAVTQGLNWHWIFWINVPVGLAAAGLARLRLAESRGPAARLDLPGAVLVAASSASIAWGLVRAAGSGWGSREVIAALGAGGVLLAGFAAWERRAPEPMLPLRLLQIRPFAAANASAFLMFGAISAATFLLAQYFQLGLGYSPWGSGWRFLPLTIMPLLIAPAAGALADRIGPRPLLAGGLLALGTGLGWITLVTATGSGYGRLIPPLVIAGAGIAMAFPASQIAAMGAVPPADMGKASGVVSTLLRFGGVFGVAAVAAMFTAHGSLGAPASVVAGFRPALAVSAAMSFLGAVIALAVGRRRRPPAPVTASAAESSPPSRTRLSRSPHAPAIGGASEVINERTWTQ
jgi:EmrB/QacA subfamily drug resistance transporter